MQNNDTGVLPPAAAHVGRTFSWDLLMNETVGHYLQIPHPLQDIAGQD